MWKTLQDYILTTILLLFTKRTPLLRRREGGIAYQPEREDFLQKPIQETRRTAL